MLLRRFGGAGQTDAAGSETLNYDKMGREANHQRITNGISRTTSYTYDLAGDLATLTYPSGRTITYTTSNAGWPAKAVDVGNQINYILNHGCNWGLSTDGVCHTPWGAVLVAQSGYVNSSTWVHTETAGYNKRMQPNDFSVFYPGSNGIGVFLSRFIYNYTDANGHNNGNVMSIQNYVDGTRSQQFTYDQVNRILTAGSTWSCGANCWSQTFTYDEWANLITATATGSAPALSLAVNANNRITTTGFNYDAAGNLTSDVTSSYAWNAESEIKTANGVNYTYDGDGNRVMKSNGKIYWYGAGTEILEETDATGSLTNSAFNEYIYFAGKRLARRDAAGNTFYYFQDALGTSRGVSEFTAGQTSGPPNFCYDADFYPYGGEKQFINTCAPAYKFEGKERDTETGNDDFGARYYSSVYGRWLSPDWSAIPAPVPYANLSNPQTLNLYAMVADNPETFADLDGHCERGTTGQCAQPNQDGPQVPSAQNKGWSLSWQISASANFLGQELMGVADATVLPVVNAVEHPIDTVAGIANAVEHPVDTAKALVNGAVDTAKAAASGDPRAFGQVVGTAATVAYAAENVKIRAYENTGGGGINFKNTPTTGSSIRFDVHPLEKGGAYKPHVDMTIKKPGVPSGPGSNLIKPIHHWPWE